VSSIMSCNAGSTSTSSVSGSSTMQPTSKAHFCQLQSANNWFWKANCNRQYSS
jgi:hypothetical protein